MTDQPIPTKTQPGPFDGFESLKPGEPFFPLQGGDPLGSPLVQLWADAARVRAGVIHADSLSIAFSKLAGVATREQVGPHKREELQLRATEAEAISWEMDAYRKGEKVLEQTTESYSGYRESKESKEAAQRTRSLYDLASNLEEAKFHANETALALKDIGDFSEAAAHLNHIVGQLHAIAVQIRPHRRADAATGDIYQQAADAQP